VSRKGTAARIKVSLPLSVTKEGSDPIVPDQRGAEDVEGQEGLVFHLEVGYKVLLLVSALIFQALYAYADSIAKIFGYYPSS